jgi:hypothetical protein
MKATLVSRAIEMRGAAVYFLARVAFARCEISHIEAVARTGRDGVRFQESFCRACSMLARTSLTHDVISSLSIDAMRKGHSSAVLAIGAA